MAANAIDSRWSSPPLRSLTGLLIQVERFEDSLDLSNMVLEKEPDRVPTLINKAIALKMIKDYEKSYEVFTKILTLETDENIIETVKQARAALLSLTPTVSTNDSKFEVHVLVSIRDKDNNLIPSLSLHDAVKIIDEKFIIVPTLLFRAYSLDTLNNDTTLIFANSRIVQFKKVFTG